MVIIFHCEYSSHRAPASLRHVRKQDRIENYEKYPQLFYPDLYLLHGGYHNFYSQKQDYCEPKNYVSMFDSNFTQVCRGEMSSARQRDITRSLSFSGPFGSPAPGVKKRKYDRSKDYHKENLFFPNHTPTIITNPYPPTNHTATESVSENNILVRGTIGGRATTDPMIPFMV